MEEADLVIVGAGWYGLVMAKTYQQVNPDSKIIIFDKSETVGGVWAKERLYDFTTNNMTGSFEFSDFPMTEEAFEVKPHQHIPSTAVHEYLRRYAEKFNLTRLIRFSCKVESAELLTSGSWLLAASRYQTDAKFGETLHIETKNLVVATGILSDPFMPDLRGSAEFEAPQFHSQDLGKQAKVIKAAKSVVVLGASKSAWDACYLSAINGSEVHWIIRASGNGPTWMAPDHPTPLKIPIEILLTTRVLSWFSPCIWGDADGYGWIQRFLHGTWLGRKIVRGYWYLLSNDLIENMGYDKHPETKKLKSRNEPFWGLSSTNVRNYDINFMELVRSGRIRVHVADISHLSHNAVHLSEGTTLSAEVFICATGWKLGPHIKFLPDGVDTRLGLPHYSVEKDELAEKADKVVLDAFPSLREGPKKNPNYAPMTSRTPDAKRINQPFRLYRFLVPASSDAFPYRNLAFPSAHHVLLKPIVAQTQALWVTAYLGNRLILPSDERVAWSTMLWSRFVHWRWPGVAGGAGEKYPEMTTEWLPYVDVLLKDLGMKAPRKSNWWSDCFSPYKQSDYAGLVEEWMQLQQSNEGLTNEPGRKEKTT